MYVLELAGEDDEFATYEASNATRSISILAPGIALADEIDPDRITGLAFTHRINELIDQTQATLECAMSVVETMPIQRSGTVAVRARDVRGTTGISTQQVETNLGSALVARGFTIDLDNPDNELRVLFSDSVCFLSWLVAKTTRRFGERAPTTRPFFQPGSMGPMEARAIANFAQVGSGTTVLDPMCGTGGLLLEAGLLGAVVMGIDVQRKMTSGAVANLTQYLNTEFEILRGDASQLPVCGTVDAVVFDVPYGRQSKVASQNPDTLVHGALAEARRISNRCVLVGDQSWEEHAVETGWCIQRSFKRHVHRSLTRHIHVLTGDSR